jgi:enoyl-CoA hydratase/carnithine racemase
MTDSFKFLQIRRDGPALIATMSNPPKNFLNASMVAELHVLADRLKDDAEVRVLVLTGGAEGIFITHYDVGELSVLSDASRKQPAPAPAATGLHTMHRLILKLQALPQPVIAAINGTAMGGGCELAIGCDFRYMSTDGVIGCPEVRVGILPGAGGTQRITRLVGVAKAMELMLLGDAVNAVTAERIGLIHRALPPEELLPEAIALAYELASRPPLSVALIKQCILQGSEMPLADGLRFEQEAFFQTMRSDDAARLMRAYLQSDRPLNEQ